MKKLRVREGPGFLLSHSKLVVQPGLDPELLACSLSPRAVFPPTVVSQTGSPNRKVLDRYEGLLF